MSKDLHIESEKVTFIDHEPMSLKEKNYERLCKVAAAANLDGEFIFHHLLPLLSSRKRVALQLIKQDTVEHKLEWEKLYEQYNEEIRKLLGI